MATEHLARPDASVLAIVGSGVQARSHLEALRLVRDFRKVSVRAYSPKLVEGVFYEIRSPLHFVTDVLRLRRR